MRTWSGGRLDVKVTLEISLGNNIIMVLTLKHHYYHRMLLRKAFISNAGNSYPNKIRILLMASDGDSDVAKLIIGFQS